MPILDGNAVIKAIQSDSRLRDIPIILASALPEKTIRERCDGYTTFLRKPYKTEQLMEEISKLLDHPASKSVPKIVAEITSRSDLVKMTRLSVWRGR